MKQAFIAKRFDAASALLIRQINTILTEYEEAGYDLSLRQLYYQLVSKNIVENTERSYKNVGTLVSNARLAGLIDWDIIKDRGREMVKNSHWDSPAQILEAVSKQYRIDRWENQPYHIEVMVEKQALEGVLIPVCRELDVNFTANKGYSSSSAMYEAGRRIYHKMRDEKEPVIIYLGDHDPSGIDMSRDVLDRLKMFTESDENDEVIVEVERIALNMPQIETFNPPKNPAKISDPRAKDYLRKFGQSSWELDAIEPKKLAALVTKSITKYIDADAWEESGEKQDRHRERLLELSMKWEDDS